MTAQVKIAAFAGSTRQDSLNKKLIRLAAKGAEKEGAAVTLLDLRDFPMPFYDGDLEAQSGLPEQALRFKEIMRDVDGFLIASPEYNAGYSGVLKNAIDWASRPNAPGSEPNLAVFTGKHAALLASSPGALGGLRGLYALREMLQNNGLTVLPRLQAVGQGAAAFDEAGALKDEKTAKAVHALGAALAQTISKMKA